MILIESVANNNTKIQG